MRSAGSRFLTTAATLATGTAALAYVAYRNDIDDARRRIETETQSIGYGDGSIEFAESGNGPAVLLIHGAGGGFDQGLELGRAFVGDRYRIVAPSRFGYLGTPLLADSSPEAQADAHLRLLDALQLDRVPVIGVSAGAPSAMQLCLAHPERCSALVLVVPMAWTPQREAASAPSPFFEAVLNAIAASDVLYWTATKVARMTLLKTILGTPVENYRNATANERRAVDRMLRSILPISRRAAGIWNDSVVSSNLTRYPLEDIRVPTLIVSAADDLYGTYESSFYTAEEIGGAMFVGFATGGHLLIGHQEEVQSQIRMFLFESALSEPGTAQAI
ncbi:MAG: alpha/beta hydrolase [Acidobacteria bacterium]|nr:alpha/beta hydrolase [Acidobacteriota bacterium]MBV9067857.1 alpha/beta hydrolase [Acidobacteriota bacterium]MBV9186172.1 alpha/beta hydrolase [Acidobacteriota bacterium]